MKRRLLSLFVIFLAMIFFHRRALAQYGYVATDHYLAAQVNVGSQGLGLDARYGVSDQFSARLGGSFLPANVNNAITLINYKSSADLRARFYNVHLLADYLPSEDLPWLRVVGGGGYLYQAKGSAIVHPNQTFKYGDIVINQSDIGGFNVDVSWKGFAPYLGLGFLNAFPTGSFNMNIDFGTYYMGSPHTTVTGTKLFSQNGVEQQAQFDQNLKGYRFYPVLQINFNYKIN